MRQSTTQCDSMLQSSRTPLLCVGCTMVAPGCPHQSPNMDHKTTFAFLMDVVQLAELQSSCQLVAFAAPFPPAKLPMSGCCMQAMSMGPDVAPGAGVPLVSAPGNQGFAMGLAVPGLTVPWSHAGYLWLATAASIAVHEVRPWSLLFISGQQAPVRACASEQSCAICMCDSIAASSWLRRSSVQVVGNIFT